MRGEGVKPARTVARWLRVNAAGGGYKNVLGES
jgi:hypothetical protein